MSNYTKLTDFAAKDSLLSGNPAKKVTGTAHDNEYNAIAVAIATKLEAADIGVTVQAYDADLTTWAGVTPASGVTTFLTTPSSANLKTAVTDETGSGALVFADTPTLVTPVLGTPTSGTLIS